MIDPVRQPVHPLLAHFPIAFLLAATVCDVIAARGGGDEWWRIAHHALAAGLATGLLALIAGIVEVLIRPISSEAYYWLIGHAAPMQVALVLYLVSFVLRGSDLPSHAAILTGVAATVLLVGGIACGGVLVYRFRIGTRPRP